MRIIYSATTAIAAGLAFTAASITGASVVAAAVAAIAAVTVTIATTGITGVVVCRSVAAATDAACASSMRSAQLQRLPRSQLLLAGGERMRDAMPSG